MIIYDRIDVFNLCAQTKITPRLEGKDADSWTSLATLSLTLEFLPFHYHRLAMEDTELDYHTSGGEAYS